MAKGRVLLQSVKGVLGFLRLFNEWSVQALRKYGMWRVECGPVRGRVKGVWYRLDVKLKRVDCGIVKSSRDRYKVGYAL